MKSRKLIVVAATLGTVAISAVAVAENRSERSGPAPSETSHVKITAVQPEQAQQFAIFRRGQTPRDTPPQAAKQMLGESRETGKNIGLARAFDTPHGTGWAIPGDGNLCLAMPDPVDGFGLVCQKTDPTAAEGLLGIMVDPKKPGRHTIMLLTADGADVSAEFADGTTRSLRVREGIVSETLVDARSVAVTTKAGTKKHEMPAPLPVHPTPAEAAEVAARAADGS
jgi:hypothetical protein